MTTMQPARVARKGDIGVNLGGSASLPVGPIIDLYDSGKEVVEEYEANGTSNLDEQDIITLLEAGAGVLLALPTVTPTLTGKYAFLDRWEGGLRLAGPTTQLFVRNQVIDATRGDPLNGTWGVSLGRAVIEAPVGSLDDYLEVDDFERWELEGHLFLGWDGDFGRFWFGPKVVATTYDAGIGLNLGDTCSARAGLDGSAVYASGAVGGAVGFRWIWIGLEITSGYMSSSTTLSGTLACPEAGAEGMVAEEVDSDGLMLGMELGLMAEF